MTEDRVPTFCAACGIAVPAECEAWRVMDSDVQRVYCDEWCADMVARDD